MKQLTSKEIDEQILQLTAQKIANSVRTVDGLPIIIGETYYYIGFNGIQKFILEKEHIRRSHIYFKGLEIYFGQLYKTPCAVKKRLIADAEHRLSRTISALANDERKLEEAKLWRDE